MIDLTPTQKMKRPPTDSDGGKMFYDRFNTDSDGEKTTDRFRR